MSLQLQSAPLLFYYKDCIDGVSKMILIDLLSEFSQTGIR